MNNGSLTEFMRKELLDNGAVKVGFADLSEVPEENRLGMPFGISVMINYPPEIIRDIVHMPTIEYYEYYNFLNKNLNRLVTLGADTLKLYGYDAVPLTTDYVKYGKDDLISMLPHKTVATRAGMGWIGKSAILVTKEYGSAVRLSTILTNAPLKADKPINESHCLSCLVCTHECPAKAIKGNSWQLGVKREELYDAKACEKECKERTKKYIGIEYTICGKCIAVCPYTRKYTESKSDFY